MKKRLLITSVVMMLVVAVALSTATYAWFTSNATVKASNISLTAGTTNAPSLAIRWKGGTWVTELTNINAPSTFMPISPAGLSKTANSESVASQNYYSGTIRTDNGVDTFNTGWVTWKEGDQTANAATPYYLSTGSGAQAVNSIELQNGSTVTTMTAVNVSADITGAGAKLVRIALYKYDSTSTSYKLVDVLGYTYTYTAASAYVEGTTYYKQDAHQHYVVDTTITDSTTFAAASGLYTRDAETSTATATHGAIADNKLVSAMSTYTCANTVDVGGLSAQETMELKVVIWLDGLALNDETQGFTGTINLSFTAVSPNN